MDPIMFADDTNLFLTHHDINYLFETANLQLIRIDQWLTSHKLTKYKQNKELIFLEIEKSNNITIKQNRTIKMLKMRRSITMLEGTQNIMKVKLLKILGCRIRRSSISVNIRFCHCIIFTYIPILTTEIFHREVLLRQTLIRIAYSIW